VFIETNIAVVVRIIQAPSFTILTETVYCSMGTKPNFFLTTIVGHSNLCRSGHQNSSIWNGIVLASSWSKDVLPFLYLLVQSLTSDQSADTDSQVLQAGLHEERDVNGTRSDIGAARSYSQGDEKLIDLLHAIEDFDR